MGRHQILALLDSNGTMIFNLSLLKLLTTNFFKALYTKDMDLESLTNVFKNETNFLSRYPDENELKQFLFSMNGIKAHIPNGYIALFYQNQWSNIKDSLLSFIINFFNDPLLMAIVNGTLISLIPKVPSLKNVTQFRPIILCNVNCKILSKILVQRI